jgi:hypothetical protein
MNKPMAAEDQTTGLPGLPSWQSAYLLVVVIFILWVGLLVALARIFA